MKPTKKNVPKKGGAGAAPPADGGAAAAAAAAPKEKKVAPIKKKIVKSGGSGVGIAKALAAKKNVVKGVHNVHKKKVRTKVRFFRPKTLRLPRAPKYPRKSVPKRNK